MSKYWSKTRKIFGVKHIFDQYRKWKELRVGQKHRKLSLMPCRKIARWDAFSRPFRR